MSSLVEPPSKKTRTADGNTCLLDDLKKYSVIVADTGDFHAIDNFKPKDATTNPSLILKASISADYSKLIDDAVNHYKSQKNLQEQEMLDLILDRISVNFGAEIAKIVPGYVSTEVDARLSFDVNATVQRARRIIEMYKEKNIDKSRILIKIASTYEGIQAGKILEKEGITCNLTLLFSLVQAAACAEASITLISPFVGRILDWYKKQTGESYTAETDPGVLSVQGIYRYFKKFGYKTIVMGASFRNIGEIKALAGCDRLTISPALLTEMQNSTETTPRVLEPVQAAKDYEGGKVPTDESSFRFALNEDAMATEKLAEGIRNFCVDIRKLEDLVKEKLKN